MFATGSLLLLLAAASVDAEIPLVGRPASGFYNAIAAADREVEARLEIASARVEVEQPFTLRLVVAGTANPARLHRPDLRQLPAYADAFQIEDGEQRIQASTGEVVFEYRLRPRRLDVREIPSLEYRYYQPASRRNPFPEAFIDPLPITVVPARPATAAPADPVPLDIPEVFLAPPRSSVGVPSPWLWLVPPLLLLAIRGVDRWRNPESARRAARVRSQAGRRALAALRSLPLTEPVPTSRAIAEILGRYLQQRLELPEVPRTTAEVRHAVESAGNGAAWPPLFAACEAARFADVPVSLPGLREQAMSAIQTYEDRA